MGKGFATFLVGFIAGATTAVLYKKLSCRSEDPIDALAESISKKLDRLEQKAQLEVMQSARS